MNAMGIMQGRLSPRTFPVLQAFPWNTWEQEFIYAKEIGFDFIEWLFELDSYEKNPLWSKEGRAQIKALVQSAGVEVSSVCAPYFIKEPFFRQNHKQIQNNIEILLNLIQYSAEVGAKTILIPVLEEAEIQTAEEEEMLVTALSQCLPACEAQGIILGLEAELEAKRYLQLVQRFSSPYIKIYYDCGNSAFCGYDMRQDMEILHHEVVAVHIKDRPYRKSSIYIGKGDANFQEGLPFLVQNGYSGEFVFEHFYEDDYYETAKNGYDFIKSILQEEIA